MKHDFWPLVGNQWDRLEYHAIERVVASGQFTMADETAQFEREFADYHGMKYGVMTNSGSSANLIAVTALNFHRKFVVDEVEISAVAWSTTYAPFHQNNIRLVINDCDIDTLNAPAAMYPVDTIAIPILGNPQTVEGELLMEDCCESLGAIDENGKQSGTHGSMNTFSFFHSHQISAIEGGMVLTNDHELYEILLQLRAHGWDRDVKGVSPLYNFVIPGYNVRPQEINAAIAREQLKKLPEMICARRKNLNIYQELFGNSERWRIQKEVGKSSAFAFTFITNFDRAKIFAALDEAGIGHRMITGGCFTEHPAAKYYDYEAGPLPNAMMVHKQGFFVGNQPRDLEEQLVKLKQVLEKVCQ